MTPERKQEVENYLLDRGMVRPAGKEDDGSARVAPTDFGYEVFTYMFELMRPTIDRAMEVLHEWYAQE